MTDFNNVVLSVKDLVVKFNLRGQVLTAIRGISLDLYKGESLAIVGESGSGKSVFTKTFMGLLDNNGWIDNGSIEYGGMDLAKFKKEKEWVPIRGKRIAMVFQEDRLVDSLTVRANLRLALRAGYAPAAAQASVAPPVYANRLSTFIGRSAERIAFIQ